MERINVIDDESILCTPQPCLTSTVDRKKTQPKIDRELAFNTSDESLGIISIQSEDMGPYIDKLQLKEPKRDSTSYVKEQRSLACKTLQDRGSKVSSLPSKFLRPSEISSSSYDSYVNLSNGSTVNESDLLRTGTGIHNTSTPRSSITQNESIEKIDIAESMNRMSLEIRNSDMSLNTALRKMEEEYQKVRSSISAQSEMFRPAEEAESQFLADEASWKKEKEIPAERVDFTIDNVDASKMSIGAFFKQRSEDISNIIPSSSNRSNSFHIPDMVSSIAEKSSLRYDLTEISLAPSSTSELDNLCDTPEKESLSISKIAKILQETEETPTKVLDYLLKYCPGTTGDTDQGNQKYSSKGDEQQNSFSPNSTVRTDEDSGNYHPTTLTADKENFNSINVPEHNFIKMSTDITKSLSSLRSTSSISNLPGGKLPIETTHCELIWGCVKPGKSEILQFTIRNRSSNRLRLKCTISGPLFRIFNERLEESSNSCKLMLHAHEAKTISIIFHPITDGAAADEILFTPFDSSLLQSKKQSIKLFGYGGTTNIELKNNILRDTSGRHWLSLGNILGKSSISESFTIFNRGTIAAFVHFDFIPKDSAFLQVSLSPKSLVLSPDETKMINIIYKPTREDFKYLQNYMTASVFELGLVKIVSGAEATRGRIKRVCKLAIENNLELDDLTKKLQQEILGENVPSDVIKCKESVNGLKPLLLGLQRRELVIVMEQDMNATLVPTTDETSMFHSLYQDSTIIEKTNKCIFKLEPDSLILTPPSKLQDNLLLTSNCDSVLQFEVSVPQGAAAIPTSGHLMPRSTKLIVIKLKNLDELIKSTFAVTIFVGGDILTTDVKIIYV